MTWQSLRLATESCHAEGLSDLFALLGAEAVTVSCGDDAEVFEPLPGDTPLWALLRFDALFPFGTDVDSIIRAVGDYFAGHGGSAPAVERVVVEDQDWSNTWREFAAPLSFGERLSVVPRGWGAVTSGAVLRLDPGLAFGTGTHPTTALCLDWLAHHDIAGYTVVDYGCGSGILSIAALLLGALAVAAVDYDPQARLATLDNAAYNRLGYLHGGLRVLAPEELERGPYDLLLANILADSLISLAPKFRDLVRPGGHLLLSGVRTDQLEQVSAAYSGFYLREPIVRDDWAAIEGMRIVV